jgi:hypothetical protein
MSDRPAINLVLLALATGVVASQACADPLKKPDNTRAFLNKHCVTCHGGDEPEGDVSLEKLGQVTGDNAQLWQLVLKQVATGEMPPGRRASP